MYFEETVQRTDSSEEEDLEPSLKKQRCDDSSPEKSPRSQGSSDSRSIGNDKLDTFDDDEEDDDSDDFPENDELDTFDAPVAGIKYEDDDEEDDDSDDFPENDDEVLGWSILHRHRYRFKKNMPEIYHVHAEDKGSESEYLERLGEIGCKDRVIACSVENPYRFFAKLNEDEAARLAGVIGVHAVYPRRLHVFDL